MSHDGWQRVTKNSPCPICGHPDNCTVSDDGSVVWCGRIEDGSLRENAGGQFLHQLKDSVPWPDARSISPPRRTRKADRTTTQPKASDHEKWARVVATDRSKPDNAEKVQELARQLKVAPSALHELQVGWRDGHWTIPERDASGRFIGVSLRALDGSKRQMPGGNRGLVYADDWLKGDGPVLIVEGASDTAAILSLGGCVVGRPSNTGGADLLVELLDDVPSNQTIAVVGENDRKSHDELSPSVKNRHQPSCIGCSSCWPGQFGAYQTAKKLAEQLQRPIEIWFPPEHAKDARELIGEYVDAGQVEWLSCGSR